MSGKAAKIRLTERQYQVLQQIRRATTAPKRLLQRVKIILSSFSGLLNATIAAEVGLAAKHVGVWRRRWQQSFEALVAIEGRESQAALRRMIEDVLSDAPRIGSPIEVIFGIVSRRVVRRGNFSSLAALKERLLRFIDYFNRTFAKPFRWTYTGRPTTAEPVKRAATWKENWASRRENSEDLAVVGGQL